MENYPDIPGYEILRELGEGGMGKIYLANDKIFNRKVALKVLLPLHPFYKERVDRFKYEGEVLKKLNHQNIITIFEVGLSSNTYYLAMEYLKGKSLKSKIRESRKKKGMNEEDIVKIITDIAGALEYSHSKGLIHRDIKPENILFRDKDTPVLVDFGIVKDFSSDKSLTVTGTSMGTPYYMSPEQIKGQDPDERNDIYSLGIVFYEMLTGKVPYDADDLISIALKHEKEPIPRLPKKYSKFQSIIDSMMSKNREKRLKSGTEVIRAFKKVAEPGKEKKDVHKVRIKKNNKALKKFLLFFFLLMIPIAGGYYFLNNFNKTSIDRNFKRDLIPKKREIQKHIPTPVKKSSSKTISREKPSVSLRRRYWKISEKSLGSIFKKYNFYDSEKNRRGNFRNRFKTQIVGKNKFVLDKTTFLMWDQRGSFSALSYQNARKWIRKMNIRRHGGYRNWRLPTIEEAYSILERKKWYGDLHILGIFSAVQKNIWTGDVNSDNSEHWIIDFKKGKARTPSFFKRKFYVRAVRKIKYFPKK